MAVKQNKFSWPACYTDPVRGVSFFDGVTIEADSITDPRWDRVLPILEEEQVLMCREMEHLLAEGTLILDVGTGSGVFAIYAAAHKCKVVAIDVSPRALRVAHQNAAKNHVPCADECQDFREIPNGAICFKQVDFKDLKDQLEHKGWAGFDIVLLAPPYNPTCPGIAPALHAAAGWEGQDQFNDQIKLVSPVLREGGWCVGNQMSISGDEEVEAFATIRNAFEGKCRTRYAHMLQDVPLYPVKDFLEAQYASIFVAHEEDLDKGEKEQRAEVKRYIAQMSEGNRYFSLIYYEIQKIAESDRTPPQTFDPQSRPPRTWKERTCLHRRIVDHTSTLNSFPSPALFMEMDAISNLPSSESVKDPNQQDSGKKRWSTSTLRPVDQWLRTSGALAGDCSLAPLFDVIFVDTAPHNKSLEGIESLPEECKVWVSDRIKTGLSTEEIHALHHKLIVDWRFNTHYMQRAKTGPYLHPHFTGQNAGGKWRGIQYTEFNRDAQVDVQSHEKTTYQKLEEVFEEAIREIHRNPGQTEDIARDLQNTIEVDSGYGWQQLQAFGLDSSPGFLHEYKQRLDNCVSLLMQESELSEEAAIARDLELCHLIMHDKLREVFDNNQQIKAQWSGLVGVPFSLAFESTETKDIPVNYRGGLWVYACSSQEWTYEHQRLLFDLVKLLWVLYDGKYSSFSESNRADLENYKLIKAFGHEVKHVSNAVGQKWMPQPNSLFDVTYCEPPEGSTKLGRIEIWDREAASELSIVPLQTLVQDATRQINFWCMLENADDVPFSERPQNIKELLQLCCNTAVNDLSVHAFSGNILDTVERVRETKRDRESIRKAFAPVEVVGDDFPTINWKETEEELNPSVWLTRVFVAILKNYARHGEPTEPVTATFQNLGDGRFRIRIQNRKRLEKQRVGDALMAQGWEHGAARRAANLLDKASESRKGLQVLLGREKEKDFKSRQVVEGCLSKLNGTVKTWPVGDNLAPGADFRIEIELQYP